MENTSHTSPDFAGITLEKILESSNLNAALKKVESNKGAPGVDGMKTDELRQYIIDHPGELRRVLLDGTYRPKPVKRVTIPKSEPGKFRELGIPTVIIDWCNKQYSKYWTLTTTPPFRLQVTDFDPSVIAKMPFCTASDRQTWEKCGQWMLIWKSSSTR